MSDEINMTISIPTDDDGYVLLQCEHCGTYFKGTPSDLKDDGVFNIFCPSCGLISENYVTDDVLELAIKKESFHSRLENAQCMKVKILFGQV